MSDINTKCINVSPTSDFLVSNDLQHEARWYHPSPRDSLVSTMPRLAIIASNISSNANNEDVEKFFGFCGDIEYARFINEENDPTKTCYLWFKKDEDCTTAVHLNGTFFIDRNIRIISTERDIPTTLEDLLPSVLSNPEKAGPSSEAVTDPAGPASVSGVRKVHALQRNPGMVQKIDVKRRWTALELDAMHNGVKLLPNEYMEKQVKEIQRTVYVGNLNPAIALEQIMEFFSSCGEIQYARMAGEAVNEVDAARFCFIEFYTEEAAKAAMCLNGVMFAKRALKVNASRNTIVKPAAQSHQVEDVEEIMRKVRAAQENFLRRRLTKRLAQRKAVTTKSA